MSSSRVLIVDGGTESGAATAAALATLGHQTTSVADVAAVPAAAIGHGLVVIDVATGGSSTADACIALRALPGFSTTPVLCIAHSDDVEERVKFLEAGADDVLASPFDPRELEARVDALVIRVQRSRDLAPLLGGAEPRPTPRRSVIVVFSPKGGVGTTTIAVNIAAWLASQVPGRVAIADFDVQFGQVATLLNVKPRLTLSDLAGDEQGLHEPDIIKTYADHDAAGLTVFAAPSTPELGRVMTARVAERFVDTARVAFETVVIDAGSEIDDRSLSLLGRAETLVLPIVPEIASLKALSSLVAYLADDASIMAKATFVVNHLYAREMLSQKQVLAFIGASSDAELPYDPMAYLKAANEGVPVVRGAPGSSPARAFAKLAALVAGMDGSAAQVHQDRGRLRLGGLLHR